MLNYTEHNAEFYRCFMFEMSTVVKVYILLATAILNGESYHEAGADFFVATCYFNGHEIEYCIEMKNEGFVQGMFPMDMTE